MVGWWLCVCGVKRVVWLNTLELITIDGWETLRSNQWMGLLNSTEDFRRIIFQMPKGFHVDVIAVFPPRSFPFSMICVFFCFLREKRTSNHISEILDAIHVLWKSLYLMIDDIRNYRHVSYFSIPLICMSSNDPGHLYGPELLRRAHPHGHGLQRCAKSWNSWGSHMGMGQVTYEITIFGRINIKLYQLW